MSSKQWSSFQHRVESWFESLKFWVLASLSVSSCSATLPFAAAAVLLQKVRSYLGICSLCRPQMDSFLTWKEERNEKVYSLLPSSHRIIIRGKLFTVFLSTKSSGLLLQNEWAKATICSLLVQSIVMVVAAAAATEHHHHHHHSMDTLLLTSATWCVKKKTYQLKWAFLRL